LVRRRLLSIDESAPNTERWLKFVVPGSEPATSVPDSGGAPVA
jgi:hypothetical protein